CGRADAGRARPVHAVGARGRLAGATDSGDYGDLPMRLNLARAVLVGGLTLAVSLAAARVDAHAPSVESLEQASHGLWRHANSVGDLVERQMLASDRAVDIESLGDGGVAVDGHR